MRRGLRLPAALLLVATLGLSGCGVGPTDRPVDEGDPAAFAAVPDTGRKDPPTPDSARSENELVRDFLQSAAGGPATANERMKAYLTEDYRSRWRDPVPAQSPSLTVVRIVGPLRTGVAVAGRTPVTVEYETIGTLTDYGRVDDLVPVTSQSMTFWVVPSPDLSALRIDGIDDWPGSLILSDEGLRNYYQMQPIYFWDLEYKLLVPDLRYVPLTESPDRRAGLVVDWLIAGPSPWLAGAVRFLPAGSGRENVVVNSTDNTMAIDLSAATAGAGDRDALRRLVYQLQWSLASITGLDTAPRIELRLDGKETTVDVELEDFRRYNYSFTYDKLEPPRYDIANDGVVTRVGGAAASPVLAAPENRDVLAAAIDGDQAALVRGDSASRATLSIVRAGAPPLATQVPPNSPIGRPAFVPETGFVLVPVGGGANGHLLAVSTVDGRSLEVSHALTGVTSVAVSPDGRRVAVVADGDLYVSWLVVGSNSVSLASTQRQLLANRFTVRTVTWTSESWLLVAGSNGSSQALWRVGVDGVLTEDLSGLLGGLTVMDLVCYPRWVGASRWTNRMLGGEVLAVTQSGVYRFGNRFDAVAGTTKPVYGT